MVTLWNKIVPAAQICTVVLENGMKCLLHWEQTEQLPCTQRRILPVGWGCNPWIKQSRDSLWLKQISALVSDSHLSLRARWNTLGTASAFQLRRPRAHWAVCLGNSLCCLQPEQKSYLISTTKNPLPRELRGTWAAAVWCVVGRRKAGTMAWVTREDLHSVEGPSFCFPQPFALPLKRQFRLQTEQFDPLVYGETRV